MIGIKDQEILAKSRSKNKIFVKLNKKEIEHVSFSQFRSMKTSSIFCAMRPAYTAMTCFSEKIIQSW